MAKTQNPNSIKLVVSQDLFASTDIRTWTAFAKTKGIPVLPGQTVIYVKGMTLLEFQVFADQYETLLVK